MSVANLRRQWSAPRWPGNRLPVLAILATLLILSSRMAFLPLLAGEPLTAAQGKTPTPEVASIAPSQEGVMAAVRQGDCFVVETQNLRVWSRLNPAETIAFARHCETLRCELRTKWLSESTAAEIWTPKADVVIHRSSGEFGAALGPQSAGASGCTTVRLANGRVVLRRIDLRADVHGWNTSSVSHELTHLIVADRFRGRRLPRWADEGMAVLAESNEKQAERRKAASRVQAISLSRLLSVSEYPTAPERDAFYAHSAELTDYLVSRGGGVWFLAFVERTMDSGHDVALKDFYDINGVHGLERAMHSTTPRTAPRMQSDPGDPLWQAIPH